VTRDEKQLAEAVKQLRNHLGESQQRFSDRVGVVVRTIARYELEKAPIGEILIKFAEIANEAGRPDLRLTFQNAYTKEITANLERVSKSGKRLGREIQALVLLSEIGGQEFEKRLREFLRQEVARATRAHAASVGASVESDVARAILAVLQPALERGSQN
jgi:transcriptional regulator with XRE-family HTH domain